MCGIYGLLSARAVSAPPGDELFQHLENLLEDADPQVLTFTLSDEAAGKQLLKRLETAQAAAGRWMARGAFLALLGDAALRERLKAAAARVEAWVSELEAISERGHAVNQLHRELLNRLIVSGKDIAWQLARDILGNLEPVRALLGETAAPPASPVALARACELNLILGGIDRLEVRGRDSAGLAAYVRFASPAALDGFLEAAPAGGPWRRELEARRHTRLAHGAVIRPPAVPSALLFAFKVASEVGKMGDNVAAIRQAIAADRLFQACLAEPQVEIQCLAHTRWASNGVISLANCHPVDSTVLQDGVPLPESEGRLVAVLNGDIDNYQELLERHVKAEGLEIDAAITTDAKIIPIVVAHYQRQGGSLEEAFQEALREFEGSMAIGLMAADRPGTYLFGQKGSGQGLFFGRGAESLAVASEMYGLVELTPHYIKAEGERLEGGELFRASTEESGVRLEVLDGAAASEVPAERWKVAEITTRDINRGEHLHFFRKEISESVDSVKKTLRGKLEATEGGQVRFLLGPEVLPLELVAALREGRVRQIAVLGQGTAAVAAQGVAHLLKKALARSPHPPVILAEKATEFSAHHLRPDMSDTLVVAVSQSGTTTDTNRTVDLARQRSAWILAIVNRRNSDLVYKAHGVLYTSDGRDIEMSVASTKAFYAQNVAGQVLALALGSALGSLDEKELRAAVADLRELPGVLQRTLELDGAIAEMARKFALRRRHWAVVGSGAAKIAADEIRIKLSELCYKSIAVDHLEDKKHIDLSSEPLVLICAGGLQPEVASDAVKEVAIFKAHNAIPLVIADEGEDGFDPYAAGIIKLPACRGALGYLPATMAGHLFGYHAAASMDQVADRLRSLRAEVVRLREEKGFGEEAVREVVDALSAGSAASLHELEEALAGGALEGGLGSGIAVRLCRVLQLFLGRIALDAFVRQDPAGRGALEIVLATLIEAISELSRPIDAIKHQAKTVTVGISRGAAARPEGHLWRVFRLLGLSASDLAESQRLFLGAFEPLVAEVEGVTLYRVAGLDPLGRPAPGSTIAVERKVGCAARMLSRCEEPKPLAGHKWAAVKHGESYLGYGQSDGRKILIVPVVGERPEGHLLLYHLELAPRGEREQRLKALAARGRFLDRLKAAVTERNLDWDPALIDSIDNDVLFLEPAERVAGELAQARSAERSAV
jgi:glucosamine--fructose-6-phosphate aminotransferase (isomerizing)